MYGDSWFGVAVIVIDDGYWVLVIVGTIGIDGMVDIGDGMVILLVSSVIQIVA